MNEITAPLLFFFYAEAGEAQIHAYTGSLQFATPQLRTRRHLHRPGIADPPGVFWDGAHVFHFPERFLPPRRYRERCLLVFNTPRLVSRAHTDAVVWEIVAASGCVNTVRRRLQAESRLYLQRARWTAHGELCGARRGHLTARSRFVPNLLARDDDAVLELLLAALPSDDLALVE